MYFKRKVYDKLLEWKKLYSEKYAVLLEGARRVGKSTIAETFAKNEYRSYILIDFSKTTSNILECFDDIGNLNIFFLRLQAETGITLYEHESLIIFDEVQLFPKARQAIKHLIYDGRYSYLETGSLISIKKNVKDILIPSEEMKIEVYPMDYEEFCDATGSNYGLLQQIYDSGAAIGQATNRKLMRDLRIYMAVGGMPQAVEAYVNGKNFSEIDMVKRQIISLYEEDFKKIDASGRISALYHAIPAQLAKENRKFIYGVIKEGARAKDFELAMEWLIDAGLIYKVNRVKKGGIPLSAYEDFSAFKLFMLDTGLMGAMSGLPPQALLEGNVLFTDYKGAITEQYVLQQLKSVKGLNIYYWSSDTSKGELDFLLQKEIYIIPVEVKAEENLQSKSLRSFVEKNPGLHGIRFSMSDYRQQEWLTNYPLYSVGYIF